MVDRDKVDYRDKTPFDQEKLQDLQTIKDAILHKQFGKDVRAPIAQLPDALIKLLQDANTPSDIGVLAEIIEARGGLETLGLHEQAQNSAIEKVVDEVKNARSNNSGKTYGDLKQRLDNQENDLTRSMNDKIAQISAIPEVFSNLAALQKAYPNGRTGLFVTADNGHKYIWENNNWTDAGFYQAVGDDIVSGELNYANPYVQPFNDLDTLPINKIITYATSDFLKVKNIPLNVANDINGATVVTLARGSNNAGAIQFLTTSDGNTYRRIAWGDPITYSSWRSSNISNLEIKSASNTVEPYDDLNTIPENTSVLYAGNLNQLKNGPSELTDEMSSGIVKQISTDTVLGSIEVILLADSGQLFYRMIWGDTDHWQEWQTTANGRYHLSPKMVGVSTGVPYDDLNTFPMNQTIVIAESPETLGKIKNIPPVSPTVGGLNVHSYSWSERSIGGVQIAIDNENTMYHRIAWGEDGHWGEWVSDRVDEKNTDEILPDISMFPTVGIIGDSYASGELAFDGNNIDHYEISWLQQLARRKGFVGTNFSYGGSQTRHWLVADKGKVALQNAEPQDLYICALGINDLDMFGTEYLGSADDINVGNDTYYGNYGKIITAIKEKAPNAKIIMATLAGTNDETKAFNEAIKSIAKFFKLPVIDLNSDNLFNSEFYLNNMVGGHPTAPVYSAMASAYARLINQVMYDEYAYFSTFKK